MSEVEAWLDAMPGETRGVVARDGRFERLLIHRDSDPAEHRLGSRLVGRVDRVDPGLAAAFVDLGGPDPLGFLALRGPRRPGVGDIIEIEVVAEPRGEKGPALSLIGHAEGRPRLLAPGPSVAEWLARWAPDVTPTTGASAIRASWDAEEAALAPHEDFADVGINLAVERTRALVAVDVDHRGGPIRRGKAETNRFALTQAARIIRLKSWGGLVVVDLVGGGHDGAALTQAAKAAFQADGDVVVGPVSRLGLLQLAIPWRMRPVEETLYDGSRGRTVETRALAVVRALRHAALSDTATPRFTARCCPEEAAIARDLAQRVGPRVQVLADPAIAPGRALIGSDA
jgi:Ribonuclease G/E